VASSEAWKSVALARSQEPSTAPHSIHEDANDPSSVSRRVSASNTGRRLKAFVGVFTLGRAKTIFTRAGKQSSSDGPSASEKGKQPETEETRQALVLRASRTSSRSSRYSAASGANQSVKSNTEKGKEKGKFPFSCCSVNLFQDGIAYLGTHGGVVR
jgi:hypothetical protein